MLIDWVFTVKWVRNILDLVQNTEILNKIVPYVAMMVFMMLFYSKHSTAEVGEWKPFKDVLYLTTLLFMIRQNPRVQLGNLSVCFAFTVATPLWQLWFPQISLWWSDHTFTRVHYSMFVICFMQSHLGFEPRVWVEWVLSWLLYVFSYITPLKFVKETIAWFKGQKAVQSSWDKFMDIVKSLQFYVFLLVVGIFCSVTGQFSAIYAWIWNIIIQLGTNIMTGFFSIAFCFFALWYALICIEETKVKDHTRSFVLCTAMVVSMLYMSPRTSCSLTLYNKKSGRAVFSVEECDAVDKKAEVFKMIENFKAEYYLPDKNNNKTVVNVTELEIENLSFNTRETDYLQCTAILFLSIWIVVILDMDETFDNQIVTLLA